MLPKLTQAHKGQQRAVSQATTTTGGFLALNDYFYFLFFLFSFANDYQQSDRNNLVQSHMRHSVPQTPAYSRILSTNIIHSSIIFVLQQS
jgi:hypothetical protein